MFCSFLTPTRTKKKQCFVPQRQAIRFTMKRLHTRIGSSIALALALAAAFLSQVADLNAAQFEIIPTNQMWRYIVPTDNAFCLNGTGWETPGFNDSAWAGPAPRSEEHTSELQSPYVIS